VFVGYPRGIAVGRGYLGPRDVTRKGAAGQRDAFFCAAAAVPKTVALAARIEPAVRMKRQRNPGASTQGSQVVPGFHFVPSGLQRCWRNNQHKTFSRRDLRPSYAHGGERRIARSPDERQRNPGPAFKFASRSRISRSPSSAGHFGPDPLVSSGPRKKGRRNAGRRVSPTSAPATFILPACGGG